MNLDFLFARDFTAEDWWPMPLHPAVEFERQLVKTAEQVGLDPAEIVTMDASMARDYYELRGRGSADRFFPVIEPHGTITITTEDGSLYKYTFDNCETGPDGVVTYRLTGDVEKDDLPF